MKATLLIHVEPADTDTKVVWWAESAEMPGFSAAADTLAELRRLVAEAINAEWPGMDVIEKLVGEQRSGQQDAVTTVADAAVA